MLSFFYFVLSVGNQSLNFAASETTDGFQSTLSHGICQGHQDLEERPFVADLLCFGAQALIQSFRE